MSHITISNMLKLSHSNITHWFLFTLNIHNIHNIIIQSRRGVRKAVIIRSMPPSTIAWLELKINIVVKLIGVLATSVGGKYRKTRSI